MKLQYFLLGLIVMTLFSFTKEFTDILTIKPAKPISTVILREADSYNVPKTITPYIKNNYQLKSIIDVNGYGVLITLEKY